MDTQALKTIGCSLLNFDDSMIEAFISWIDQFPRSGRAPKGKKTEFDHIKAWHSAADLYRNTGLIGQPIGALFTYYDQSSIHALVDSFLAAGKTKKESLVIEGVTFLNRSSMAEKRFLALSKILAERCHQLTEFHRTAIDADKNDLKVVFKSPADQKARATYKSLDDEIWVRSDVDDHGELYGHLQYCFVHELGHRYEYKMGLPTGFYDRAFYTTKYSYTEGMAASECFAEAFAVSHFDHKFSEYTDTIQRFKRLF